MDELVKYNNYVSRAANMFTGQSGGIRHLPYAFTEQGIYMLMTVLRGYLAVRQNRALTRAPLTDPDEQQKKTELFS